MATGERPAPNPRNGRGEGLREWHAHQAFAQMVDQARYRGFRRKAGRPRRRRTITSNEEYWDQVRRDRLDESAPVRLSDFYLTEWVPLTPGRFHTSEAAAARTVARYHVDSEDPAHGVDYRPAGKRSMIQGGIGTVRLPPLDVGGGPVRVLSATSDGVCHSGVPLLLGDEGYGSVIPEIRERGGLMADVSGVMRLVPEVVRHHTERLVLDVTDIRPRRTPVSVEATACVAFYTSAERRDPDAYSYITFRPGLDGALETAVEWLDRYARRFSEDDTARIVGDFDAFHDHFPDVEIPLDDVARGVFDPGRLRRDHPRLVQVFGDLFSGVNDATIINRSVTGEP
ncbi:hypothetical protein [Actinomadura sp. DC4]|uniref:hypothetical protein n=1 Tax=Actinomadura sp. DC4 TaxID=3055069 RepID=UPI0025AF031F|nr:hypothetical protein [Actinomadura sp. DC4]MDN3353322.1 hypothetical protein [Actinomadura sp. DC4]